MKHNKVVFGILFFFLALSLNTGYSWGVNVNITDALNLTASYLGFSSNYELGFLSDAGDYNNDGYNDFMIASPYANADAGQVYIYYGSSNPATTWGMNYSGNPNITWGAVNTDNLFGYSLDGGFDFNNDGYDDIIVGAPIRDQTHTDAGMVYLLLGDSGLAGGRQVSSAFVNASWIGDGMGDEVGRAVAGIGDFNNDGYDDVAFVAPEEDTGGANAGMLYIVYGRQDVSTIGADCDLGNSSCYNVTITGETAGDYLGTTITSDYMSLHNIGDYNNDSYDDFAIGTGRNDEGTANNAGQIYLLLGRDNITTGTDVGSVANASWWGEAGNDYAGIISKGGDVNNDGYDDFLIGVPDRNNGEIYLILGNSNYTMDIDLSTISNSFVGESSGDSAGFSVSIARGNNDSFYDMIFGAPYNDFGGADSGKIYLMLGNGITWGTDFPLSSSDASGFGENISDNLGYYYGLAFVEDINNDSFADAILSAPFNDNSGLTDNGEVYLILGRGELGESYCNGRYKVGKEWHVQTVYTCENEVIPLSDNLTIQTGGSLTFINITLSVNNTFDGENGINITSGGRFYISDNSEITATNTSAGYLIEAFTGSQLEINNSRIEYAGWNGGNAGLEIASTYANITNSNFTNNYNGLNVDSGADYLYFYNNIIADSDNIGLQLRSDYATVELNSIYNYTDDGIELSGVTQSIFNSNNIYNGYISIGISGSASNNITDNDLWNNTYSGMILIAGSNSNNISYNRVYNNVYGMGIASSSNIIEYNNVSDNSIYGILFNISASDNSVSFNNIYNSIYGLYNSNSSNTSLFANDIYNNTVAGVYTDNPVDITLMDIHDNAIGLQVNGTDIGLNYLYNFTISNSTNYEIDLINSSTIVLNVTFNKTNTNIDALSDLNVTWYFYAQVLDDFTFLPINNTNILVYDFQNYPVGNPVYNISTNASGYTQTMILVEFVENSTIKLNYTPHTLITSKALYSTDTSNADMDTNKNITILLDLETQTQFIPTPEEEIAKVKLDLTPDNPAYKKYDPYAFNIGDSVDGGGLSYLDILMILIPALIISIGSAYLVNRRTLNKINGNGRLNEKH